MNLILKLLLQGFVIAIVLLIIYIIISINIFGNSLDLGNCIYLLISGLLLHFLFYLLGIYKWYCEDYNCKSKQLKVHHMMQKLKDTLQAQLAREKSRRIIQS